MCGKIYPMDFNFSRSPLLWRDALATYVLLVALALTTAWIYIYKPGQLLLHLWNRRASRLLKLAKYDQTNALAWFVGLWLFTSFTVLIGLTGFFRLEVLIPCAALILGVSRAQGLGVFPRWPAMRGSFRSFRPFRNEPFIFLSCLGGITLISFMLLADMAPWFDGEFTIAGGHLARTGLYLPEFSQAQHGMVAITALLEVFLPKMSGLTAIIGWGPVFIPFLLIGMSLLLREIFQTRKWEPFAILLFLFPLFFKAHEIRGSVAGFGLTLWFLFFLLRYIRVRQFLDLVGAVVTLASAWNFGALAAIYSFALLAVWSIAAYFQGDLKKAAICWRVLFWTNVIEWLHIAVGLQWSLGPGTPTWKVFMPGTLTLILAGLIVKGLPQLPVIRFSKKWALFPLLGAVSYAYFLNPIGSPRFNWYFFRTPVSFEYLNFASFGLWGWLFAAALLVALYDLTKGKASPAATLLWSGFFISCLFQILAPLLLMSGKKLLLDDRAYLWDIWKDTTLYWIAPFMVIGYVELIRRIRALRTSQIRWVAIVALLPCLHSWEPYRILWQQPTGIHNVLNAHLAPHADHSWRSQQIYTLPMYISYSLFGEWRMGAPTQLDDCRFCTVHSYGFMNNEWPLIDFLSLAKIGARETFIVGDSVASREVYLNRQIRYANGVNTISPMYLAYLDRATSYEFYWKPEKMIRRTSLGAAYTILDPEKNLTHLKSMPDANGGLKTTLNVPFSGDYEFYFGDEWHPQPASATVDDRPVNPPDGPVLGWLSLEPGREYHLKLLPLPGQPALNENTKLQLYPRRYWRYEQQILEHQPEWGATGIMRFTGIPSASIAIEDMIQLMTAMNSPEREAVIHKYKIRYIVLDPILQTVFPNADQILQADANLKRHGVNSLPVFEFTGKL